MFTEKELNLDAHLSVVYSCDKAGPKDAIVTCQSNLHGQPLSDYMHSIVIKFDCDRKVEFVSLRTCPELFFSVVFSIFQ